MSDWYHLSEEDKRRIEKAINRHGRSETTVKRESDGTLSVLAVDKKKIS